MKILSLILTSLILCVNTSLATEVNRDEFVAALTNNPIRLEPALRETLNERFRDLSDTALAAASGADIVGNGSGYIEQNFLYIYTSLDRTISQCLSVPFCAGSIQDRATLRQIREVILKKREEKSRLVFLKSNDFIQFFENELDPSERIAKTGFSSEFPIYINLSLVQEMKIGSDLSLILSILAHEVGHQVGISSHSYLDELATRLRGVFFENTLTIELLQYNVPLKFMVLKARENFSHDETIMSVDGVLIDLPRISIEFKCPYNDNLLSSTLTNPHWDAPIFRGARLNVTLEAWGEFLCQSQSSGDISVEKRTVTYRLSFKTGLNNSGTVQLKKDQVSVSTR